MFKQYYIKQIDAAPLVVFRMSFGILMVISMIRFWLNGWIEKLYIEPTFSFSYFGFNWVKPIGSYTYVVFLISVISALCVAIGFKYRFAIISFFLSFTYIELMDKTTYLNHYYFVSLVSFVLIFLPANALCSVDNYKKGKEYHTIPQWTIDSIKLLIFIVYFYAGLAKLNSDWLFRAMPLTIWLPSKYDLPIIGNSLMQKEWFHYGMSWCGLLYDLCIPFLLWNKKTRRVAFILVVFFHIMTRVLFPIGMFPYLMIFSALIFFDSELHQKIVSFFKKTFKKSQDDIKQIAEYHYRTTYIPIFIAVFLSFQLILPWRYLLYPGELFWTEQGFRFSWRVMLMEKAGHATFKIVDSETNHYFYVDNSKFLTSFQEKQMSFQPDFILEYAHFLGDFYTKEGHKNIEVYVDSFVALNGRLSTRFIEPNVDLYKEQEGFNHKHWIIPFSDDIKIKGL